MRVIVIAALLAGLAGCSASSGGGASGGSATSGTVTVWDTTPLPAPIMAALNNEFMKENPGIKIDRVAIPYSTYPAKVRAAIASHTGPDVYQLPAPQWVFQYGTGLMPLSKYITSAQRSSLQGMAQVSQGLTQNGTPYALPWQIGGFTFYYNKALFRKAGLNPANPPATWSDLLKDSAQLKSHGVTPIAAGFKDGFYFQWFMDAIAGQLLTPAQANAFVQHPDWTNNAVLTKSINDIRTLYNDGYFTANSTGLDVFTGGLPTFSSGKAAMALGLFGPVDYWGDFSKAIGTANLGTFAPPLVPGAKISSPQLPSKIELGWAISKKTAHASAAYKYISFMTSPPAQSLAFQQTGVLPNNSNAKPKTANPAGSQLLNLWEKGATYVAPISSSYEASTSDVMWQSLPRC